MKFYPQDYLYDTRILTLEERGFWMDLLCFMWNSPERGKLAGNPKSLAQMIGVEWLNFDTLLDSLKAKGVCDVLRLSNGDVTLLSRRMLRDCNALKLNAERQQRFRESNILRQKRYREKLSNAKVTPKKSEARSQKLDKDPIADKPQVPTDLQKVVKAYKLLQGYPKDDSGWDKLNFARCCKPAKQLLDFLGGWEPAVDCLQDIYEKFTGRGLTVTLETVVRHASEWKMNNCEKEARNGIRAYESNGGM